MISSTHLHAMALHFPFALLIAGSFFQVISLIYKKEFLQEIAFSLLILGMVGMGFSYFAGSAAGESMEEGLFNQALKLHEQAATTSLWLTIIASVVYAAIGGFKYYKGWLRVIAVLLFAAVIGSIARTGYSGGQLVFENGAGIELALPDFSNPGDK